MELLELIKAGFVTYVDPFSLDPETDVHSFLAEYGGLMSEIAVVAKGETGKVAFRSMSAPSDPNYSNFFKNFTSLASELGIRTYGVVHAFGDEFMAQDFRYVATRSGGTETRSFVCPTATTHHKYIASVCREVARFPVQGIILAEFMFPRQEYCYCKRCVRGFAAATGFTGDTFFELSKKDIWLDRFAEWRSEMVGTALREIIQGARTDRKDVEVITSIPVDPETQLVKGARNHFGLDLDRIISISEQVMFHLYPWTPLYPEPGTSSWMPLLRELKSSRFEAAGYKKDLMAWGLKEEYDVYWLSELKKELKAERVFARLETPQSFNAKRVLHRGMEHAELEF